METRLLIGGELVEGDGARLEVEDPAREEVLATVGTPEIGRASCRERV